MTTVLVVTRARNQVHTVHTAALYPSPDLATSIPLCVSNRSLLLKWRMDNVDWSTQHFMTTLFSGHCFSSNN